MEPLPKKDDPSRTTFTDYDYSNFYYGAGDDPLNLLGPFGQWYQEALPNGYYLYSEPLSAAPGTRVMYSRSGASASRYRPCSTSAVPRL